MIRLIVPAVASAEAGTGAPPLSRGGKPSVMSADDRGDAQTSGGQSDDGTRPYLSFVTAYRNDDYAGGPPRRLMPSLRHLAVQCERFRLPCEAVIVEWNPPVDRSSLVEVLRSLPVSQWLTVRVVTVPAQFHRRLKHWDVRAISGAHAVNCGLRRARGQFAVLRSGDVFYPDDLFAFLAARDLRDDAFYRCDRVDIDLSPEEAEVALAEPGVDIPADRICDRRSQWSRRLAGLPPLHLRAAGDFTLTSLRAWHAIRGYAEPRRALYGECDTLLVAALAGRNLTQVCLPPAHCVYKCVHAQMNDARLFAEPTTARDRASVTPDVSAVRSAGRAAKFLVQALMNRPPRYFGGRRIESVTRVSAMLVLTYWLRGAVWTRSRHWGLGKERLPEATVNRAAWDPNVSGARS